MKSNTKKTTCIRTNGNLSLSKWCYPLSLLLLCLSAYAKGNISQRKFTEQYFQYSSDRVDTSAKHGFITINPGKVQEESCFKVNYNNQKDTLEIFVFKSKGILYQINYLNANIYSLFQDTKEVPKNTWPSYTLLIDRYLDHYNKRNGAIGSKNQRSKSNVSGQHDHVNKGNGK